MNRRLLAKASVIAVAAALTAPQAAFAQGAVDAFRDEILVTATKKADAENVQDVPLAVTALGEEQLDALQVRDLQRLSYSIPSVQLDDVGTARGVANFTIRGLGINSSIPSIDPTVGVFTDGMYLGINAGVVLDIFDLESVEVLRGPQGILFGRNVTGGAVLINTRRPNLDKFEANFKGSAESGFNGNGGNYTASASVSGPLIKNVLAVKVAGYYNNDRGYFDRYQGGPNLNERATQIGSTFAVPGVNAAIAQNQPDAFVNHGKAETFLIRPSVLWAPTDGFEFIVRYEHGDSSGDGPSAQNHFGFRPGFVTAGGVRVDPARNENLFYTADKNSFDFSIDEPGFYDTKWDQVTAEANLDVAFGDGTITNIFGWRQYDSATASDIDATPLHLFHAEADTAQDQFSNEIRYNGEFFDRLDITTGFYYFNQDLAYAERRSILGGLQRFSGGGSQEQKSWGVFAQGEYNITGAFSITLGGRYTYERKDAQITSLFSNRFIAPGLAAPGSTGFFGVDGCSFNDGECPIDVVSSATYRNFTPKVGVQWENEEINVYAHWTTGVRSGGYNFRNTTPVGTPQFFPGPFDEEKVNAYEVGFKAQPAGGIARINAAVYLNQIQDLQREVNLADPVAGVLQIINNTADASIFGFETEAQVAITDRLLLTANFAVTDGSYRNVVFNLNSDFIDTNGNGAQGGTEPAILDQRDELLEIPRLVPYTFGAGFIHDLPLPGLGTMTTRFNYNHREPAAYTDNNLGILNGADIIDASVALTTFGEGATISLYGQNLLNEVTHGGETQLPSTLGGGSFAPLNKGRIIGLELRLATN